MNDTPTADQILDIWEHLKQLAKEAAQTHGEVALIAAIACFVRELIECHEPMPDLRTTIAVVVCEEIMKAVTPV